MAGLDRILLKTKNDELLSIVELVNKYFGGNLYQLLKFLDKVIYMFHYIPESDLFSQREKQSICFALMELKEGFLEAFFEIQSKQD
tara:strand:+ start:420 stop:677 length:258 start_codon:yes stop_codon:yes gene_type:complete